MAAKAENEVHICNIIHLKTAFFHTNEDEGEGITLAFWRLMRSFERSCMTSLTSLANGTGQWVVHRGVARNTRSWRPQGI